MACDATPLWGGPYNVALVARFFPDRNVRTRDLASLKFMIYKMDYE